MCFFFFSSGSQNITTVLKLIIYMNECASWKNYNEIAKNEHKNKLSFCFSSSFVRNVPFVKMWRCHILSNSICLFQLLDSIFPSPQKFLCSLMMKGWVTGVFGEKVFMRSKFLSHIKLMKKSRRRRRKSWKKLRQKSG